MKTLITAILAAFVAVPTYARLTGTDPGTDIRCDGPSGAEICVDASGNLIPTTDNDATLGTSSLRFSTIHSLDQTIGDDLTVTDDLTINGDTTLGNASADVMTVNIGTIVVSNQVEGLVIATHTSVGGPVQTIMQIDGENRRICINCLSSEAASDALQVLDDGVALGAGTPTNTVGEGDLFVSDDLEVDGDIRVDLTATVTGATTVSSITASGLIRRTLPVAEVIGAGGIITADGCGGVKLISSAAGVTTDTTNTFTAPAAGNAGCFMIVCNTNASDTITLDDNANFIANGSADIVLGAEDCVAVVSSGASGAWRSVSAISSN